MLNGGTHFDAKILAQSPCKTLHGECYVSFKGDKGAECLSGTELAAFCADGGELAPISGAQKRCKALINQCI